MKETTQLIKFFPGKYMTNSIVFILILILSYSTSFARNIEDQTCEDSRVFTDLNNQFFLISYNEQGVILESSLDSYISIFPKNIDLNLFLNIGYDAESLVKFNSINLKSFLFQTYINAIYRYEKQELEFSLSNSFLNDYLFDGMKLEFKANPSTGSGAILFVMTL
ncbi:MAG: hypothetical protein GY870_18210 [archaeon]|nr:hypothetical protein [archaeon]